jgi:uncharacterized membrane protein
MKVTSSSVGRESLGLFATGMTLLLLDLLWLGVLAADLYSSALGPLLRPQTYWPAAALFYTGYVVSVWVVAVRGRNASEAAKRGAAMGAYGYGVYELTNWAVLKDWPAWLVPIDWLWGTILTGLAAGVGGLCQRGPK